MAASTFDDHTWQKVGENSRTSADSDSKPPTRPPIKCPECGSSRIWKDGLRYVPSETGTISVQRYICRECGRRFSEDTADMMSAPDSKPGSNPGSREDIDTAKKVPALGSKMGSNPTSRQDVDLFGSYLQANTRGYNRSRGYLHLAATTARGGVKTGPRATLLRRPADQEAEGSGREPLPLPTGGGYPVEIERLRRRRSRGDRGANPSTTAEGKGEGANPNPDPAATRKPYEVRKVMRATKGQVCTLSQKTRIKKRAAGATKLSKEKIKGTLVNFNWYMKKNGYKEYTITSYTAKIKTLVNRDADLWNPDHVKTVIAAMSTSKDSTKKCYSDAYDLFIKMEGLEWKKPRYKPEQTLPFIPTEKEIDQLTMGCGQKMRAFLQGLKETGADPGELLAIEWEDIDFVRRKVTMNHPVKGHNPRILNVSDEWLRMISRLPRTARRVWTAKPQSHYNSFKAQRQRRGTEYGNPRLERITFRTFRHWKGTMEYHRTHDVMHVKELLGHKRLSSTQIYIHLEEKLFQQLTNEFIVRRTVSIKGMMALAAVGFEKFDEVDGVHLYRKPKLSGETFSFGQKRSVSSEIK